MKTPIDYPEVKRLERLRVPRALALVRDLSRRGGIRVARVAVLDTWIDMHAAAVAELRTGAHHILPFSRLAKLHSYRRNLRARIRPLILCTAPAENPAVPITASPEVSGLESGAVHPINPQKMPINANY